MSTIAVPGEVSRSPYITVLHNNKNWVQQISCLPCLWLQIYNSYHSVKHLKIHATRALFYIFLQRGTAMQEQQRLQSDTGHWETSQPPPTCDASELLGAPVPSSAASLEPWHFPGGSIKGGGGDCIALKTCFISSSTRLLSKIPHTCLLIAVRAQPDLFIFLFEQTEVVTLRCGG